MRNTSFLFSSSCSHFICIQAIEKCAFVTRTSHITSKLYPTELFLPTTYCSIKLHTHRHTYDHMWWDNVQVVPRKTKHTAHIYCTHTQTCPMYPTFHVYSIYCTHTDMPPCTPHVRYTPYTLISFSQAWTPLWKDFSISCRSRNLWRSSSNLLSTVCKGWTNQYRQWSHTTYTHTIYPVSRAYKSKQP